MDHVIPSRLTAEEATRAMRDLLRARSVSFEEIDGKIRSTYIPFPLFSWSRSLYSRDNWVGVNPFLAISYVEITCSPRPDGGSQVAVSTSAARATVLYAFLAVCLLPLVVVNVGAAAAAYALVGLLALFTFRVILGRALPAEIRKAAQRAA